MFFSSPSVDVLGSAVVCGNSERYLRRGRSSERRVRREGSWERAKEMVVFRGVIVELDFRVPVSFRKASVFCGGALLDFVSTGSDLGTAEPSNERN